MKRTLALAFLGASIASGQCVLNPATGFNLGTISSTRLKSTGENKMLFLFVDFPDAPATEDAQQLYDALVPFSKAWYDEVSYGRMKLTVTPVLKWYRMPLPSTSYNFARGLTFALHKQYIGDAVKAMDSTVDFAEFDGAYIMASKDAAVPFSPTWIPEPGQGISVDGVELRHVVTLGADTRLAIPTYRWHVIHHETGHLMGLPDLYLYAGADIHAPAGAWTNMGLITVGAHYTAWEKRLLGWLRDGDGDFVCVNGPSTQVNLSPLERTSGVRGLAVQVSPTKAIVAEARNLLGQDARLCDSGLLVYTVDSSVASGNGALVVQRSLTGTDTAKIDNCGSPYASTFDLGQGKPVTFRDTATGITLDLLAKTADGGFTVRVTNPLAVQTPNPVIQTVVNGGSLSTTALSPGSLVAIFGTNLADAAAKSCAVNGALPLNCGGVSVTAAGKPAPMVSTTSSQVTVQLPYDISGNNLGIQLSRQTGGQTLASNTVNVPLAPTGPGIFTTNGAVATALHGSRVGVVSITDPAQPGETVIIYGTGFGATTPAIAAGSVVPTTPPYLVNAMVSATIGGQPSTVLSASLAPGLTGTYQLVIKVPDGIPAGQQPLRVVAGGVASQSGVILPIAAPAPVITGVSNNASGAATISAASWVTIYGTNLSATTRIWQTADFSGKNLPQKLDDVTVTINGKPCAIYYVSPTQVNVQAPSETATGTVAVRLTNGGGLATGTTTFQTYSPGFFTFQGKYAAAVHTDGAYVAPAGYFGSGVNSRPAQPGETLLIFGTGFGPTTPAVAAGIAVDAAAPLADPSLLRIRINSVPAAVPFAGLVASGEYQINVVVPILPDGDHLIVAEIAGAASQAALFLPVKN